MKQDIFFYLTVYLLLVLSFSLLIKNIKYKKYTHVKGNLNKQETLNSDASEFRLYTKIKGEKYYISLNKANNSIVLLQNKHKSCIFTLITPTFLEELEDTYCLKIENNIPKTFIHYVYPDCFNTVYSVKGYEQSENNTCLLKFSFNKKHSKFSIKFDNDMYLYFSKETLEVFSAFNGQDDLKKLYLNVESLELD